MTDDVLKRYLEEWNLYREATPEEKEELLRRTVLKECKLGEVLAKEGESAENFFFLCEGVLRLKKRQGDKVVTHQKLLAGEHYGNLSYLDSEKYLYTLVVAKKSKVLIISTKDLKLAHLENLLNEAKATVASPQNKTQPKDLPVNKEGKSLKVSGRLLLQDEIIEIFKNLELFKNLEISAIEFLAKHTLKKELKLGEELCFEGEAKKEFIYIYKGGLRKKKKLRGKIVTIGKLGEKEFLGEISFLKDTSWEYSLAAIKKTIILTLDTKIPEIASLGTSLFFQIGYFEFRKYLENLFKDYQKEWFEDFIKSCSIFKRKAGEKVFAQGDFNLSLYLVLSGKIDFFRERLDGRYFIGSAGADEFFGEYGALNQKRQEYEAIASRDSVMIEIDFAVLPQLFNYNKILYQSLLNNIENYDAEEKRQVKLESNKEHKEEEQASFTALGPKKFPWLKQHDETDCGAACLTMISRYYGLKLSMGQVREMANVSTAGATMAAICRAAENLGYRARGVKSTFIALRKLNLPLIVHWQGFHYIVLYRITAKQVFVSDPDLGLKKYTHAEFKQNWTGFAIELEATENLKKIPAATNPVFRFLAYLLPYKFYFFEILMGAFILNLLGMAAPLFTQAIIDKVIVYNDSSLLNMMLLGMVIVAFFSTLTSGVQQLLSAHITAKIDFKMLAEFYKHVLSLPLKFFYQRKIGDIITRFGENGKVRAILTGTIVSTILNLIMLIVFTNIMFMYSLKLSLVVIGFIPFFIAQTLIFTPIFIKLSNKLFLATSEQSSMMIESIQGIETVKANGIEWNIRTKWEEKYLENVNMNFKTAKISLVSGVLSQTINTASSIAILYVGATQVMQGTLSVGELMAFNAIIGSVMGPLMGLVGLWNSFKQVQTSMDRLNDVLELEPEERAVLAASESKLILNNPKGDLELVNLSFRYGDEDSPLVINHLNLEVKAGQQIAFVGSSGCGKSTLTKLIPGFLKATEGAILIDGHDIKDIDLNSLRTSIGWVLQDSFLFNATVAENIALGYTNPDEKEVIEAADLAAAHEFIQQLPHGYQTKIGEKGLQLSGGQKQRICIARALFRNPKILIFDEATSALDVESEKRIQQNLDKILKGRTSFVIAHRLSTVRNADLICYLDRGVIMEKGTHQQLMAKKGLYYQMASSQLGSSE